MRRVLAVCLATLPCRSQSPDPATSAPDERRMRVERGLLPAVRVHGEDVRFGIEDRMREYKIPAVSVAVFDGYELQWAKPYGMADVEKGLRATEATTFLAGSISKSVNALAQLQAVADGLLDLDAPINDSLASWKLPDNELTRTRAVTLRMLLSHTGGTTVHGFRGYFEHEAVPTTVQTLEGAPPANHRSIRVDLAPGTRFRYSGGGTTISQLALSDLIEQPYAELMATRVLQPLGMTQSSYDQSQPARTRHAAMGYGRDGGPIAGGRIIAPEMAAAGLWTTAGDLARFFLEVVKARAGKSSLIAKEVAVQMTTKVAPLDDRSRDAVGLGVFLFDRNGTTWFGHGGGHVGFQCDALASIDGGHGVVIMTNSENGHRIFGDIQRAVFAEYGWPGADQPLVRVALADAEQAKFVGRFLVGATPFEIVLRDGRLMGHPPFEELVELVPIAADRVVERDDGTELRLRADGGLDFAPKRGAVQHAARNDAHYLWLVAEGQLAEAVDLLRQSPRPRDEENRVNNLGYRLLAVDVKNAVAVLSMNATAFPDSANAHDSLGEAYATAGDTANAIAAYRRAAATVDADDRIEAERKAEFRKRVDEQLGKLENR